MLVDTCEDMIGFTEKEAWYADPPIWAAEHVARKRVISDPQAGRRNTECHRQWVPPCVRVDQRL